MPEFGESAPDLFAISFIRCKKRRNGCHHRMP